MLPFPAAENLELLRRMLLIRRWEERLIAHAQDEPFGHYHVYVGQEAIGVPVIAALRRDDLIFTTHRNHGHLLARGADPGRLLAEVLGRATGLCGGRGGTLHASAPELGIPHTSAVVGGTVPIAAGAALAQQRAGQGAVTVSFFGDGALEEGAVFEALNLAALWRLPVVFVCENNSAGALGPAAGGYPGSVIAAGELGDVARAVGVPATAVDGADAAAVHAAAVAALARARSGEGPGFIDAIVERWPGSKPLWPALPAGETELRYAWEPHEAPVELRDWYGEHDGVLRFARELVASGACGRPALEALDAEVREEVEAAVRFARASPFPDPSEALHGVYARPRAPSAPPPPAGGRELTFAEALVEALDQLMEEDERLVVIGSYMLGLGPWRTRFDPLRERRAGRVLDPPTAELGFCGVGVGAARGGPAACRRSSTSAPRASPSRRSRSSPTRRPTRSR
jgi:TPP-dependent pyruvate/acetoin dehydrogenase alpha subunit